MLCVRKKKGGMEEKEIGDGGFSPTFLRDGYLRRDFWEICLGGFWWIMRGKTCEECVLCVLK